MGDKKDFEIPKDWLYRGEGNMHLVLSLPKIKKVLRIRKILKPAGILQWIIFLVKRLLIWWSGSYEKKAEQRDLAFYSKIMRPLFGYQYVPEAYQVEISKRDVKKVEKKLNKYRPEFRKNKTLDFERAALFQDFTFLQIDYLPFRLSNDTFTVEIKPKKGWKSFIEKQFPKCIFCMNQYLKIKSKKASSTSKYCPMDLFSGKAERMKKSILALLENPQNNFKILKNGKIVYDESHKMKCLETNLKYLYNNENEKLDVLKDDFCELLIKCLTTSFGSKCDNYNFCDVQLFCEWDNILQGNSLPKGCVLEKILSVQMLDTEGINYYKKKLSKNTSEWGYINKLLSTTPSRQSSCIKCSILMLCNSEIKGNKNQDLAVVPYLIAAVANDCSLMITLKYILDKDVDSVPTENVISSKLGNFCVNIGILDLYPKPTSTIWKNDLRNKQLLALNKNVYSSSCL